MIVFTILRDGPNEIQLPISSTIKNKNQYFKEIGAKFCFLCFYDRHWKKELIIKTTNLNTKWVGQRSYGGIYAHKNIKMIS